MARKGTRQLNEAGAGPASLAWREAVARARGEAPAGDKPRSRSPETWVRDEGPARVPQAKRRRTPASTEAPPPPPPVAARTQRKKKELPQPVAAELADAVDRSKVPRVQERLTEAAGAYERDRYRDAARMLKPLAEQAPGAAAVRELYGLTLYRLGRWNDAIRELEAFRALSDGFDQHPTLADCYRAKKRWKKVDELWEELRLASPGPELLAEGRIVAAGALADRGRIADAIELLERGRSEVRRPKEHQLRTWYALADLYERAGEVTRAREIFSRILQHDRDLYDVAERLAAIR